MVRLVVDTDNSIYIGGNSYSTGSSGKQDSLIIKLSSTYTQEWGKFFGGSDNEDTGDIDISSNGLYISKNYRVYKWLSNRLAENRN